MDCQRCALAPGRTRVVFGTGNVDRPPIAFVGEAPGANEDEGGEPFVGRAGKVLNEFIAWMGLTREQVYILNPVMCRPPKNRAPMPEELAACRPHFEGQLQLIRPRVVVALGRVAATSLVSPGLTLSAMRGGWYDQPFGPVRVTYHPAYILRNPAMKAQVYDDLRAVRQRLDALLTGTPD